MAARFWVGGSGNWDAVTTTHWSATSGGSGGVSVPTTSDDVTFDASSGSATITVTATANCSSLVSTSANNTLTIGSSTINCVNTWTWTLGTLNAASSTITMTGASASFSGLSKTYGTLNLTGSGVPTISGANTYTNLNRTGTAINSDKLNITGSPQTVTNLTLAGDSVANMLLVQSSSVGTKKTINAANVTLSNVIFMDITGGGAAAPFIGTRIGDGGGNTGITFDTSATQTFVGGTKSWSDPTSWTSRVPLPQDDVVVNTTTAGTLTMDMPYMGRNLDFTSFNKTLNLTVASFYYGNLTLGSGMTLTTSASGNSLTTRGRSSYTITTNGITLPVSFAITTLGTYTLGSNLALSGSRTLTISLTGTIFNASTFSLTAPNFTLGTGSTVNMGSGIWTLINLNGGTFTAGAAAVVNSQTSTIAFQNSTNPRTITGGGHIYNILDYSNSGSTGVLNITDSNTFATFNFSDASNARTLTLTNGTTQTITGAFNVNGTSGKLMTINSDSAGVAATLSKSGGVVSCDYLSLQDSTATGGASWFAGTNSTNVSGNSGWIFNTFPVSTSSDIITTSEAVGYYSETIFTREQITIFITSNLVASDSITFSENIQRNPISSINVSDTAILSENFQNGGVPDPGVNDTITLSESVHVVLIDIVGVNDNLTFFESTIVRLEGQLRALDTLTIAESFNKLLFNPSTPIFVTLEGRAMNALLSGRPMTVTLANPQEPLDVTLTGRSLSATISGRPTSVTLSGKAMNVTLNER